MDGLSPSQSTALASAKKAWYDTPKEAADMTTNVALESARRDIP
jgi:hypothetical protein